PRRGGAAQRLRARRPGPGPGRPRQRPAASGGRDLPGPPRGRPVWWSVMRVPGQYRIEEHPGAVAHDPRGDRDDPVAAELSAAEPVVEVESVPGWLDGAAAAPA